jgi:hypothetical protein
MLMMIAIDFFVQAAVQKYSPQWQLAWREVLSRRLW